jgi:hypothetical protein
MANSTRTTVSANATKGKTSTTTKPRARKSAARKPTAKAKRVAVRKAATENPLAESERRHMIAEAAYYLAQKRGFSGGDPVSDWIAAESEIDTRFRHERSR